MLYTSYQDAASWLGLQVPKAYYTQFYVLKLLIPAIGLGLLILPLNWL